MTAPDRVKYPTRRRVFSQLPTSQLNFGPALIMEFRNVLLIGGTGFLGSRVANLLAKRGVRVTVATRRFDRAKGLTTLPTIRLVEADVHDQASLDNLAAGQDAIINLVGILHGGHGTPFSDAFAQAHVELPKKIVAAAKKAGIRRVLHVSALNADTRGPSQYLRSKGEGEVVFEADSDNLDLTIFRPSVLFGQGDSFLTTFACLQKMLPVVAIGGTQARFQPVFVEDVALAMVESLDRPETIGKIYPLVGPKVYTLGELVNYVGQITGKNRTLIPLGEGLGRLMAGLLELLPNPPMSVDNLDSMDVDSVLEHGELPFGIKAQTLESIAPSYLAGGNPRERYMGLRAKAGR